MTIPQPPSGVVGQRPKPRKPGTRPRGSSGWSKRPSGSACHVSTSASGTGSPAPSSTRPRTADRAPACPRARRTARPPTAGRARRTARRSATASSRASRVVLVARRRRRAAQHDVPAVRERPLRLGGARGRTRRSSARAPAGSRTELKIGSWPNSGSPGKYICVTSRCVNARPNSEKWMCAGRHALRVVAPRVGAGLDRHEAVAPVGVGQAAAQPGEVRVERRGMAVAVVPVATAAVALPQLDERVAHRAPVLLEHAAVRR